MNVADMLCDPDILEAFECGVHLSILKPSPYAGSSNEFSEVIESIEKKRRSALQRVMIKILRSKWKWAVPCQQHRSPIFA